MKFRQIHLLLEVSIGLLPTKNIFQFTRTFYRIGRPIKWSFIAVDSDINRMRGRAEYRKHKKCACDADLIFPINFNSCTNNNRWISNWATQFISAIHDAASKSGIQSVIIQRQSHWWPSQLMQLERHSMIDLKLIKAINRIHNETAAWTKR